jgi:hypothetical protein
MHTKQNISDVLSVHKYKTGEVVCFTFREPGTRAPTVEMAIPRSEIAHLLAAATRAYFSTGICRARDREWRSSATG